MTYTVSFDNNKCSSLHKSSKLMYKHSKLKYKHSKLLLY